MKLRSFTLPLAYLVLSLLWLAGLTAPAAAQAQVINFSKIIFATQTVEVRKADGSIANAEFLFEAVLHPDGRANGGWGMWELSTPPALTLYRIVGGRVSSDNRSGPFFEFKAQRLSPLPSDEITISLRPVPGQNGSNPKGQWTMVVQDAAARELLSFVAEGRVRPVSPIPTLTDLVIDSFGYINALPQTVVVQTSRGSYTANFENVALVFPSGNAIGLLALSGPDGTLRNFRVLAGEVQFHNGVVSRVLLHARQVDTEGPTRSPLPVLIVLADRQDVSEPCRIYDIAGTQVHAHFEAQANITIFRN